MNLAVELETPLPVVCQLCGILGLPLPVAMLLVLDALLTHLEGFCNCSDVHIVLHAMLKRSLTAASLLVQCVKKPS